MNSRRLLYALLVLLLVPLNAFCAPHKEVVYATIDDKALRLDLYMPQEVASPPLVVFFHGGGWRGGSYKRCSAKWLTEHGMAVASIEYRLSGVSTFPAQVHDCKGAVRWLRANQSTYGYNAKRIGATGTSAGGHLALMLGLTAGHKELEGDVGGNLDQSSGVQAIVDYYGPSDFLLRATNQPSKTDHRRGSVRQLLGGPVKEKPELAKLASPVTHVGKQSPPLLILHGKKDRVVYFDQAESLVKSYEAAKRPVRLEPLPNAGHGGKSFFTPERRELVAKFLKCTLAAPAAGETNQPAESGE